MRVLAIETATVVCAIGVRDDASGREVLRTLDHDRRHTEVLTGGVRAALTELGLVARDLDRVVVDVGPGLFTGLRVGIAAAQALAAATGADLVGVSSLDVLAHAARTVGVAGDVLAAVDARRGELFTRRYDEGGPADAPRVVRPDVVASELADRPATLVGDGALRYADLLAPGARDILAIDAPPVDALLALGRDAEPGPVAPLYMRAPDAVANFSTRDRS